MRTFLLVVLLSFGITVSAKADDDDDALSADSTAEQVTPVFEKQVNSIIHKYIEDNQTNQIYSYPESGIDQTNEAAALVSQLSVVKFGVILDLLNQTRPYDQQFDPKIFVKRQTLFKVLMNNVTDTNLPDLLASTAPEALWVVSAHVAWQNNPALTSFLITQLQALPSEADDQTPPWIVNEFIPYGSSRPMPSQTWEWSILNLASLNNDPAVQEQFSDAIQRAGTHDQASALFLCNALDVVSHSDNPRVIAQATGLLDHLVSLGQFPYERVSQSVELLVNAHPELLKDRNFDTQAVAFIKHRPYGLQPYDSILLARLGDPMAFVDTVAMYFNKDFYPYTGASESQEHDWKKQFNQSIESELFRVIDYQGSGDRQQAIKENYHKAVFQDGRWVVTDSSETAPDQNSDNALNTPSPAPTPAPVVQSHPNADKLSAALDKALAAIPNPAAAPPARIAVTARVPIEALDGSGQVTAVTMATVGAIYDVVRVEDDSFIVKDASGTQYRIAKQAASAAPAPGAIAN